MDDRENVFGPDRDGPPGITQVPGQMPPEVTDWMSESAAMHSQSRGWLPCVVIRIWTGDDGFVCSIPTGPALDEIIRQLMVVKRRARNDLKRALQTGQIPPHEEMITRDVPEE